MITNENPLGIVVLFNTVQFAAFFIIVYCLYLLLKHKGQNRLLLIASYVFYGCWDWRFLSLLFVTTLLNYVCGLKIHQSSNLRSKKLFLISSVIGNLLFLGFFKYFNFFIENLQRLLEVFGPKIGTSGLVIILPIGISFYTFQAMSYTIDIYRGTMKPTRNFINFALFVSFFPQIVAGPIERANRLLPQILSPRKTSLNNFYEGFYLVFWGLFEKVVVADNLAKIVDPTFAANPPYEGLVVLISLYAFAFQIFCDFDGYSNIARGLAKCMGFDIMVNFNLPYFATNPYQFWKRWHISLSSWLRDYLYMPLANRYGLRYRTVLITMLVSGLWHGAAWTFIFWGLYQGILLIAHREVYPLFEKLPKPSNPFIQKILFAVKVVLFFHLICFGWLIFRAESMSQVFLMLKSIFTYFGSFSSRHIKHIALYTLFFTWILIAVQYIQFRTKDLMVVYRTNEAVRTVFYVLCYLLFIIYGVTGGYEFIYFQF